MITADLKHKIEVAIKLIEAASQKAASVNQPLEICYSGGKDSDVILQLARMSNANIRVIYKNTTIDPPGTISHVKENQVEIVRPEKTFKQIIEKKGIPSRKFRFCCARLKEYKILDYAVMGIRREESEKRKNRYKEPEICRVYRNNNKCRVYLPILQWTNEDIANFIAEYKIKCHPLYYDSNNQFNVKKRLGCMGCPLASKNNREKDFIKYPKLLRLYVKSGDIFLKNHPNSKMHTYISSGAEWIVCQMYCKNKNDFIQRYKTGYLFEELADCRKLLELKFHVSLD